MTRRRPADVQEQEAEPPPEPHLGDFAWTNYLVRVDNSRACLCSPHRFLRSVNEANHVVLLSMPGGEGKRIVPNVDPTLHAMDDTHIYWVNNGEVALYRAPKNGGAVETVWDVPNRWVVDLAVDACNVYWTVLNPPEIYARAK